MREEFAIPAAAESTDADPKSAIELLDRRIKNITAWLKETAPECLSEQAHLDEGSRERTYWHYGYLVALMDMRKLLERTGRSLN